jgi:dTDP-4-dehydrorhamnose 3,5-epimerase
MKILSVTSLAIPEIKVIRFARFRDMRGYSTEIFRKSDLFSHPGLPEMRCTSFVQVNQSYSNKKVIRGIHSQWNPFMGKLVRTVTGHMVDLALDIRKGSPSYGKIIAYDMPSSQENSYDEWIWVPAGFSHGNYFKEDTLIEYFCTGEYNEGCQTGISPYATDLDWSLCDKSLKKEFDGFLAGAIIAEKDRNGLSLEAWTKDKKSENFLYEKLKQ